jgi:hypothetical protein
MRVKYYFFIDACYDARGPGNTQSTNEREKSNFTRGILDKGLGANTTMSVNLISNNWN